MIIRTFAESFEWTSKIVHPFVTFAVGASGAPAEYQQLCRGARMGEGLAVQGEEVRQAAGQVEEWLRTLRLLA